MNRRLDQTALVTGASAGIGLELAHALARKGFDLVLVARREAELSRLAGEIADAHGVRARIYPLDLLQDGSCERLQRDLERDAITVDVLVNNAGVVEIGAFHRLPRVQLLRLLQLNTAVPTELSHRFLPGMVARRRGRILNVASITGFQPVPALALYAATKAFLLSLTESLSEELKGTGVTVTALCPGLTQTAMVEGAKQRNPLARLAPSFLISDPRKVAREGVEACLAGRVVVVPGVQNRVQASLVGFYPRAWVRAVGGLIGRRGI